MDVKPGSSNTVIYFVLKPCKPTSEIHQNNRISCVNSTNSTTYDGTFFSVFLLYVAHVFKFTSYLNSTSFFIKRVRVCWIVSGLLTVGYVDIALCGDLSTSHLDG